MYLLGNVNGEYALGDWDYVYDDIVTTPDPFYFPVVVNATAGQEYSSVANITGVTPGVELEATNLLLSNDSGVTWGVTTTYVVGATLVKATLTSALEPGGVVQISGEVNGVSASFVVITARDEVETYLSLTYELYNGLDDEELTWELVDG